MNRSQDSTSLRQEFLRIDKAFLVYLATIIIYLSYFKDVARVGFKIDWLSIRLMYLPFILTVRAVSKTKPLSKKFYELPVWGAGLYITAFCTYFSLSTGNIGSDYINGLIQFYFGIAIMPITTTTFFGVVGLSLATYIGVNLEAAGLAALPPKTVLSNLLPLFVFSSIIHLFTARIRGHMIRSQNALAAAVRDRESIIAEQSQKLAEAETKAALGRMAAQIAHDLRSPIAALGVVMGDMSELPSEKHQLLRSVYRRMQDITNGLLIDYRRQNGSPADDASPIVPELISGLLESIVSEKRIELRPRFDLDISFSVEAVSHGIFGLVRPKEFKRVLSNLINNAAESIRTPQGKINVTLSSSRDKVIITVRDTGRGIPQATLFRLNADAESASFGKVTGSGLGLTHAKQTIAAWGGTIMLESVIDMGTKVTIELPRAKTPDWFVERVFLKDIQTIVMVDDDASIHSMWNDRLKDIVASTGISLIHISSPTELKNASTKIRSPKTLFLVDFEFASTRITGLDLIEELGIEKQAILVTSHFEESEVRTRAANLGTKILPKMLAPSIPFVLEASVETPPRQDVDVVLIDDDRITRAAWEHSALEHGIRFKAFGSFEEFCAIEEQIPKTAALYIDSDLGNGRRGELLAENLAKIGFKDLSLASGYEIDLSKRKTPWITRVIGKDPPWIHFAP